jgi:hypothetical protein
MTKELKKVTIRVRSFGYVNGEEVLMAGEYVSSCGCKIHVIQESCALHKNAAETLQALKLFYEAYEAMTAKYPDLITTAVSAVPPTHYGFKTLVRNALAKAEGS